MPKGEYRGTGSFQTIREAMNFNIKLTCTVDGCSGNRFGMYSYCRPHATLYRRYGHPEARYIPLGMVRKYEPEIEKIVYLNQHKDSFRKAVGFLSSIIVGNCRLPDEFKGVPSYLRATFDPKRCDPRVLITRLGALALLREKEPHTILCKKHLESQYGKYFLFNMNIRKFGLKGDRPVFRLYETFGKLISEGIGSYLLNLAKTAVRADREREAHNRTLCEPLDY